MANGFDLILKTDPHDPDSTTVCVQATIEGRPYEFLLDTGAATTRLRWDTFTRRFPAAGMDPSSGILADTSADLITVRDFQLGPIVREQFTVARMAEGQDHTPNLIGMDLLKDYCCSFLFSQKFVSLDPPASAPQIDLFLDRRMHPYVRALCMGAPAQAVWDTGASITLVDLAFIEAHPHAFQAVGQSTGTDASGASVSAGLYEIKELDCGGYIIKNERAAGVDLSFVNTGIERPMDMILGYTTLSQVDWVFDFPRRKWGFIIEP